MLNICIILTVLDFYIPKMHMLRVVKLCVICIFNDESQYLYDSNIFCKLLGRTTVNR